MEVHHIIWATYLYRGIDLAVENCECNFTGVDIDQYISVIGIDIPSAYLLQFQREWWAKAEKNVLNT